MGGKTTTLKNMSNSTPSIMTRMINSVMSMQMLTNGI
jgi:hypothetical protein